MRIDERRRGYQRLGERRRVAWCGALLVAMCAQVGCGSPAPASNGVDAALRDATAPADDMAADTDAGVCSDGMKDGDETDVDCGGSCMPCATGQTCKAPRDCQSGVCANKQCLAPSCTDMVKNGDESDKDCGGSCQTKCAIGQQCNDGPDCASGYCFNGTCAVSQCQDGKQDGTETDVDCGGSCPPCLNGQKCGADADCKSARCLVGMCRPPQGVVDFAKPVNYPLAATGYAVAGDFNEDKVIDLAVEENGAKNAQFSIFLGKAGGTFIAPNKKYESPVAAAGILAAADFNMDGHLDIATDAGGLFLIAPGNGDGTLGAPRQIGATWLPTDSARFLVSADFNNDRLPEVITGLPSKAFTFFYVNKGQWDFVRQIPTQSASTGAVVADVDNDGNQDAVVSINDTLSFFLGDGTGMLAQSTVLNTGKKPNDPVALDFNGDGKIDLAVANEGSGNVSVFLGQGGGNFAVALTAAVGMSPSHTVVGDFNRDGKKDLLFIVADQNDANNSLALLLGMGNGHFQQPKLFPLGATTGAGLVVEDFNKDGYSDVAVVLWSPAPVLSVLMNLTN